MQNHWISINIFHIERKLVNWHHQDRSGQQVKYYLNPIKRSISSVPTISTAIPETDTGTSMPQAMPYRTALYPHIPSLISSSGYRKHQAKNGESAVLMAEKYSISGCPILKEAIPVAKKNKPETTLFCNNTCESP